MALSARLQIPSGNCRETRNRQGSATFVKSIVKSTPIDNSALRLLATQATLGTDKPLAYIG
jgi:hypothetical protein